MADTVSSNIIFSGPKRLIIQLNNASDGTGESAVVKVDKSTFNGLLKVEPATIVVEQIDWMCDGMTVKLLFDRTTDIVIANLVGTGYSDFRAGGGLRDTGTGDTGDILLTTTGHSAGDSYKILLHLRFDS